MKDEIIISQRQIENRIFNFRGTQIMLDRDLAEIYGVETRVLNQAVKRNLDRFPESFRFQLTIEEFDQWKSQIVMSSEDKMGLRKSPYAFTELGIAMLSAVLRSETAIKVSIRVMQAFVDMRKVIAHHQGILQRLEGVEKKQLETDHKFERIFNALENRETIPTQGVFFDGQVFDAYELASKIIRSAKQSIVLIDNYMDESVLVLLGKKKTNVKTVLLTKNISKALLLDVRKANEQYPTIQVKTFDKSHDRFLIIDHSEVYHLGASLKDLGKKWFAFSKMDKKSVSSIMNLIKEMI